jgi:hypothetical protein
MALFEGDAELISFSFALLLLLLNSQRALHVSLIPENNEDGDFSCDFLSSATHESVMDADRINAVALHTLRFWNVFTFLDDDLGFWVKPRSTT